jgi:hypothetical protein
MKGMGISEIPDKKTNSTLPDKPDEMHRFLPNMWHRNVLDLISYIIIKRPR